MNNVDKKYQTPEGTYDLLPSECAFNHYVKDNITNEFSTWGYQMIETPVIEYYDVFAQSVNSYSNNNIFKAVNSRGSLIALRPDITTPVARMIATKMNAASFPLKLYYTGEVYSFFTSAAQPCERTQAGIELIGDNSPEADAEVIALAIYSLQKGGLQEFQIEMGQIDFFNGLMEEAGLAPEEIEKVREMVEQKNMLGVELLLSELRVNEALRKNISKLPFLFGDITILEEAATLTKHPKCMTALDNLKAIYNILVDYKLEQYVSLDLAMVQSLDYYTGVIFRGIAAKLGTPILTGGRYDNLLASFDFPMPATGFAIDLNKAIQAIQLHGMQWDAPKPEMLVGFDAISRGIAFAYANQQREKGNCVLMQNSTDEETLKKECSIREAQKLIIFKNNSLIEV